MNQGNESWALEETELPRKRSRWSQDVPDDVVVRYTAARAFLLGEWFGASLMIASFTLLYLLDFGTSASTATIYGVCLAALAFGTFAFVRSRAYYQRVGFDYARKWHTIATVAAGSAGVFWLLFVLLVTLAWFGVPIQ